MGRALGRGTDWIYFVLEPLAASRDDETRAKVVKEANALAGAVIKRKERPRVRAHRFGLGQLLRARVRPMAGDSPSGYSLTGQSGLVFDIALLTITSSQLMRTRGRSEKEKKKTSI